MKKKYEYEKKYYYPHLYKEDLEEIQNVIKVLNLRYFKVSGDDFETEDIKEIPIDKKTKTLTFSANPLYIRFSSYGSSLTNSDDSLEVIGAVTKINSIISKRENFSRSYLSPLVYIFLLITISTTFIFFDYLKDTITQIIFLVSEILLILCNIFYLFSKKLKIEFDYYKNKEKNFFQRNKESIINQIIGGLIVAGLIGFFNLL